MLAPSPARPAVVRRRSPIPKNLRENLALCATYPEKVLFIDVETTGLSHFYDEITIAGWSLGGRPSTFIKGGQCDELLNAADDAVAMVTFNGIRFDQRFLVKEFPEVRLPSVHLDLMYLCRRLGLTGGQKAIETALRLNFREEISDVDGFAAVLLWHQYLRGDIDALEKLILYNRADIAAMGAILDHVIAALCDQPDMFAMPPKFVDWAAPNGWKSIPKVGPPSEVLGKAPSYNDVIATQTKPDLSIVGIDLTGSEKRASGWALLRGCHADTALLSSDEELLNRTLQANPDLVSIDSPLCLPAGRKSVTDDDPGRWQFGIMRECERELKRRGVNVYPCLLPSMQKLTARGMEIARRLREAGVPVIESYPGAAQDIMRIPRKGAGVEWLRAGLGEFGIMGAFATQDVSHDELDAITAALVGSFHMAGLSEALETEEEAPLIIPDLNSNCRSVVIGVSGPIAAGKTSVARTLERQGFAYTRFSLVIDDLLRGANLPLDRSSRQKLGDEIHQSGRQRWLAERTVGRVGGSAAIVVDGLRFPEDHAFLVERFGSGYLHIFIDAPEDIRRSRFLGRDADGDFAAAARSRVESRVEDLRPLAGEVFSNDGTLSELEQYAKGIADAMIGGKECQSQS